MPVGRSSRMEPRRWMARDCRRSRVAAMRGPVNLASHHRWMCSAVWLSAKSRMTMSAPYASTPSSVPSRSMPITKAALACLAACRLPGLPPTTTSSSRGSSICSASRSHRSGAGNSARSAFCASGPSTMQLQRSSTPLASSSRAAPSIVEMTPTFNPLRRRSWTSRMVDMNHWTCAWFWLSSSMNCSRCLLARAWMVGVADP
mmetsp:Transcript_139717/g.243160  ORF Transcript_139717/g.243160 Transcript_139717/m.243160 type:complete len:202 (-) Transcript_139717:1589-2194(-)